MGKIYPRTLDPNTPNPIWKELEDSGELTHCKKCLSKMWSYWMVANKIHKKNDFTTFSLMDQCAYCYFKMANNPIKVRHLSESEIAESKVLLAERLEDFNKATKLQ